MVFKFRVVDRQEDNIVLTTDSFDEASSYVKKRCKTLINKRYIIIRTVV